MSEQPVAFDRVTGRRFVRAVKDFLTSEVRWRARGLSALLIVFAFTINGLNVVNSYVGRDFITAISHRDRTGFIRQAVLYVVVFAGSTAVAVLYRFTDCCAMRWQSNSSQDQTLLLETRTRHGSHFLRASFRLRISLPSKTDVLTSSGKKSF